MEPLDPRMVTELEALGPDAVAELLPVFHEHSADRIRHLRKVAAAGSVAEVAAVAHSLKGSAGSFGVRRMAQLSADIEEAAAVCGRTPSKEQLEELESEHGRACRALEAVFGVAQRRSGVDA